MKICSEAIVRIEFYHYDKIEETSCLVPINNPKRCREKINETIRTSRYTKAPFYFKSLFLADLGKEWAISVRKDGKWVPIEKYNAQYIITLRQSSRGSRTQAQVDMESERFAYAQMLSKEPTDLNEVYANLDYLEGKSV